MNLGRRVEALLARKPPKRGYLYDEEFARALYAKLDLAIREPVSYGAWCGRKDASAYPDIVVAD